MVHVYPIDDMKEHKLDGMDCECDPNVIIEQNSDIIIVHNSFDGREGIEWTDEILNTKP